MRNLNLSDLVTEFSDDVFFMLEDNGFINGDYIDDIKFSEGLFGFIKHRILTNEDNNAIKIFINQHRLKGDDTLHFSDALFYSLLCAGIDEDNKSFKIRHIVPMELPISSSMLKENKDSIIGELQM